jgi:HK97 family phage major capsid protein
MTLEEMKKKLAEIAAQMTSFEAKDLSEEQIDEVNKLAEEATSLKNKIEAQEKILALKGSASTSAGRKTADPVPAHQVVVNAPNNHRNHGFDNGGEFFRSVAQAKLTGTVDPRLKNATAFEKYGEDGGFLIPEDFRQEIQKKVNGDESLISRAKVFQTSGNQLVLPTNENAAWASGSGGVRATWEGEGSQISDTKPSFGSVTYRLHKLTALVKVTEELMEDAPALQSWVNMEAPEAILHKVNSAMISGNGVGMPEGILNSPFTVQVAAEGGQTADTIIYENIVLKTSSGFSSTCGMVNPSTSRRTIEAYGI